MNKRLIESLAAQSLVYQDTGLADGRELIFSTQKFTQLILAEVDAIIDDLYHAMPLEQAAVLLTLDENIKGHFYGTSNATSEPHES